MLWGFSELFIGTWLHLLHIPMSGSILAAAGVWIILVGLKYIPGKARGSLLGMGVVCASVKFISLGMVPKPNIYISIMAEAFLAETGIFAGGRKPAGYMLAGALAMLWPPFSRAVATGVLLGGDYLEFIRRAGLEGSLLAAVLVIGAVHMVIGALAGLAAWRFRDER